MAACCGTLELHSEGHSWDMLEKPKTICLCAFMCIGVQKSVCMWYEWEHGYIKP